MRFRHTSTYQRVDEFLVFILILGLVRGTIFGPVQSLGFLFGTAYGITFLIAFLAAVATFLWGHFVVT